MKKDDANVGAAVIAFIEDKKNFIKHNRFYQYNDK